MLNPSSGPSAPPLPAPSVSLSMVEVAEPQEPRLVTEYAQLEAEPPAKSVRLDPAVSLGH